jgi:hypothetical protein
MNELVQVLYYLGEVPDALGVAFRSLNHQLVNNGVEDLTVATTSHKVPFFKLKG